MKNRRESRNVVALTNHNYLKKVYEGARPLFAVVRNEGKEKVQPAQKQAEDKRTNAIQYIEQYASIGHLDLVKNMPEYLVWLEWKNEQGNAHATANP